MSITEKINKIEALIAGAKSDGERQAAEFAKQRLEQKINSTPIEYSIRLNSLWKKKLFIALCNKYELRTYRYMRQKYTTTMVQVSKSFLDLVLWPEFNKYAVILDQLTDEILTDLITQIHSSQEEETIIVGELPTITQEATL